MWAKNKSKWAKRNFCYDKATCCALFTRVLPRKLAQFSAHRTNERRFLIIILDTYPVARQAHNLMWTASSLQDILVISKHFCVFLFGVSLHCVLGSQRPVDF